MKKVLLIEDNPEDLAQLKKAIESESTMWDLQFVDDAAKAHEAIGNGADVVGTAITLRSGSGADILQTAKDAAPDSVRFAFSNNEGIHDLAKASGAAHQIISKPYDGRTLRILIMRAIAIRENLDSSPLQRRLHDTGSLPSLPVVYQEITRLVQTDDFALADVGRIIERDPGLSAKVLQVVNSAGAGLQQEVTSVVHAASLLGIEKISAIVLMAEVFSDVQVSKLPKALSLDTLWQHSLQVAEFAKKIAHAESDDSRIIEQSFTSGLLHDIGIIVLATCLPEDLSKAYNESERKKLSLFQAEKDLLGATHAQVGGYLLELWGIPDPIVEAIAYHDFPTGLPEESYPSQIPENNFTALTAVHVANYFCEDAQKGDRAPVEADSFFLDRLGFSDRMGVWWDKCYAR